MEIKLILEYKDYTDSFTPEALVYWVSSNKNVIETLQDIVTKKKITEINTLEETVDLIGNDTDCQFVGEWLEDHNNNYTLEFYPTEQEAEEWQNEN